ncbi:MAG: hypothetical protein GTN62_05380 [Gemmatimonadales bacterium]|nr:hypothetical protein [Gemmatimonadales bacterium]NIN10931.1 hypothetical protein [Gemmatimonadales bacterium]NIN49529.1 hypothetical protein [Gemmatimonadales bacterium]NIP06993.1 hypothetical protein [Gemmatimonadales bacterium]NIQ99052.1 hypothetical protein [Gemmatimonadales bacterium]
MRRTLVGLALAAAMLVAAGCAAASGGGGGSGEAVYRRNLGRATPLDVARYTRVILQRFHYQIERADSTEYYTFFETRWRGRYPFQDELDSGVVEVTSRLTIRARAIRGTLSLAPVEFTAENMVRMRESGEWRRGLMTPMAREYFRDIADALKQEFDAHMRVRG